MAYPAARPMQHFVLTPSQCTGRAPDVTAPTARFPFEVCDVRAQSYLWLTLEYRLPSIKALSRTYSWTP